MRKPNNNPKHTKNRILALVYIFRSLPTYYFEELSNTGEDKNKIRFIINNLVQDGVLKKRPTLRKRIQYVLLTKKGHDFVTQQIFKNNFQKKPFYVYRTDRVLRFTDSDHRFMNFVYLWQWVTENPQQLGNNIQIFEDTNRNYCRLKFIYGGDEVILYPDILIFLPDEERGSEFKKALIIENDTGTETSGTLFKKLVEYAVFAEKGLSQGFISQAELLFVLHSDKRGKRLLPNIPAHAKNYNATLKVKDVKALHLLQAYEKIKLLFTTFTPENENLYTPIPLDLRKELLRHNPSWTYLL